MQLRRYAAERRSLVKGINAPKLLIDKAKAFLIRKKRRFAPLQKRKYKPTNLLVTYSAILSI